MMVKGTVRGGPPSAALLFEIGPERPSAASSGFVVSRSSLADLSLERRRLTDNAYGISSLSSMANTGRVGYGRLC